MKQIIRFLLVLSIVIGCGDKSTGPSIESRIDTYSDGSTRAEYSFYVDKTTKEQVKHGPYVSYYKDGQIQSEGTYEAGLQTGIWTEYYENGIKKEDQFYRIGQPDSTWTTYSETGDPKYIRNYFNGELVGPAGESTSEVKEDASGQVNQFRMYIESFETEQGYDRLYIINNENLVQTLEGNINSGWTDWYDIETETGTLTFVFTSDGNLRYPGFDISRISFRDSDLGEETTVDVEITDGAGNYSNNAELRWNVDIPAPAQKVEYHIYRDPANNSPTKHGTYESFYEDGSFYETGTYTNGHKDGFWTGFYPNGTTRYKYCWKVKSDGSAGVLHGPSIDYNKDGSIRSEYQYSDGNKHGEFVEYHSTGTFHLKGSYKGDNRDGLWEEWADDGTKKKEYNFSEGIKEGQYKEYDNSGNLVIEGEYKEGRNWNGEFFVHVEWQEYDDNEDESEFAGYWTALVESGKEGVPGRFTYSEGVWNGNAIIYDEDGNIASEENYVAGALEGPTVVYDEDGNVTWHVEYKAGKVDGKITRFSDDGTKVSEYSYSEGIRNGEFVQYHTNGTVRLKGSYKENVWDGLREEWAEDGTKISEYNYSEGIHDGQRSYYDEDGVVLYEEVYDLGTLVESPLTGRWSSDTGSITINIDISGIASGTMSNLSSNMNELRILFDSFYTEEHFDYFSANYRSKRLKRWSGGPITSWWTDWVSLDTGFFEGGSLEFLFDSDGSLTHPGFYITMLEFRNASGETESLTVEITDGAGNYSNDQYLEWYVAIPDFPSRINSTTWSWEVLPRAIYPGRQSVSLILDGSNPVIYVIEAISPAELVLRSEDGEQVILRKID